MDPNEATTELSGLSAECLNALLRHSPDLIGLIHPDGDIQYLSPAATQLFTGICDASFFTTDLRLDTVHPDDLESMMLGFAEAIDHPDVEVPFLMRAVHLDGTTRHIRGKYVNLVNNPIVGAIAIYCTDVTEHIVATDRLRRRVAYETALTEIAHDLVDHADQDFALVIDRTIARIGSVSGADRVIMINRICDGTGTATLHDWFADCSAPPMPSTSTVHATRWINSLAARDIHVIADVTSAPQISDQHRGALDSLGIKATISIPVANASEVIGLIGLHSGEPRQWDDDLVSMLDQFAAIYLAAWTRRYVDAEQRALTETLHDAQSRFEEVFEHAPIGMALADMQGRFFRVNPALCEMLITESFDLIGHRFSEFTHPDDLGSNNVLHDELITGVRSQYTIEKRYRRSDGSYIWCRVNVSVVHDADGHPAYEIGQISDVSEQRSNADALEREARYDALTGLAGRKPFLDALERALADTRRRHNDIGVLFIDLDHFKHVNDTLGHVAGDELLIVGAQRLQSVLRGTDLACRFGGDEFMVLCPNLESPEVVASLAERVRKVMEQPFRIRDTDIFVGASIGIAIAEENSTPTTLLSQADSAAYRAKARGRNRYEIFDDELRNVIAHRLELEQALRFAIDNNELQLAYQPIISTETNRVKGFEALLRWERPGHGMVMPLDFLPIAEERDLIIPIGYQVVKMACAQLAIWSAASDLESHPTVAVNVSAKQFAHPEFSDRVERIITDSRIDPSMLTMELTETTLMDDTAATHNALQRMRALGVSLAIDDFGTGYSSLSYLRKMPVNSVKIDRSFVAELGGTTTDATIVAAVIYLSHALGMSVVAEGVETIDHLQALTALGCDYIQGFYYSKPLSIPAATEFLEARNARRQQAA